MQRRNLLRGLLGLAVAPMLPAVAPAAPVVLPIRQLFKLGGDYDGDVLISEDLLNPHRVFKRQVGLGRGNSSPIFFVDEAPYMSHNGKMMYVISGRRGA